jgi:hypothetical protein
MKSQRKRSVNLLILPAFAISLSIFLLLHFSCKNKKLISDTEWQKNGKPLQLLQSDSFALPAGFPRHLGEVFKYGNYLIYTHYNSQTGAGFVTGIGLSVLNTKNGKTVNISTGNDRTGQMRSISKIFVENDIIYTIDPNGQIISYNLNLELQKTMLINTSNIRGYPDGDVFIKKDSTFYLSVHKCTKESKAYNPLIKVAPDGEARYVCENLQVDCIENQLKDYPTLLSAVSGEEMYIFSQHEYRFHIVNMKEGSFETHNLPGDIEIDEHPALNRVDKVDLSIKERYIKNSAIKWCNIAKSKVGIVFHFRPKDGNNKPKYMFYSLDMQKGTMSHIDSLPFKEPLFVNSSNPDELLVLENNTLYGYLVR